MDNSFFMDMSGWKILIDPWLEGTEVDYFGWFNMQWHRTPPIAYKDLPAFDSILITQKYPDHFHEETLKKLNPKHIIGPKSLEKKLKKLFPSAKIEGLDSKNNTTKINNHKVTFLATKRKIDPIYDAFILDDGKESVFVSTHGFNFSDKDLEQIKSSTPFQLLITPFNYYKLPFFLGGLVSPGLKGVKHLCDTIAPKNVVATHDEDKYVKGIVSKFASIKRPSSSENLLKLSWLEDRYLEMNHYNLIQIT
ncbi:MBL fold metallo-hydrolase [Formosa maritima]|nr:MBL fold metallo-hydrolase [Formosa maritima]